MNTPLVTQPQGKGLSIAALVLGIVTVSTGIIFYISLPAGITGIVLSAVSLKHKNDGRGMALAGLITSIVGVAFGLGALVLTVIAYVHGISSYSSTTTTY